MIVVVGSINLDLIADVERLPKPGETLSGTGFRAAPGGKGANQALAAARAGARVRMVGAVGRDGFAAQALELLNDGDVDLSAVAKRDEPTGTALIFVGGDGENVIVVVPGANATVSPSDASAIRMGRGDVVLLQHEIPLDSVKATLAAAREAGATSVLNTAPYKADAIPLLVLADYVVANETEFELCAAALDLNGKDRRAQMTDFAARTGRTVVVTLGGNGAAAATPQRYLAVPALPVKPVDTVGAGDTFCGYFGAGLSRGLDLEAALREAVAAGSLACLKPGAQPAIPTAAEVADAISRTNAS